jgi:hypothetical protein
MGYRRLNRIPYVSPPATNLEQVKLLFDYTKFHIGLYSTLAGLLIAAGGTFGSSWQVKPRLVAAAFFSIVLAGLAGGVIASSLPYLVGGGDVYEKRTGPLFLNFVKVRHWTYLEHLSFWCAIVLIIAAFWQPIRYGFAGDGPRKGDCSVTVKGCGGVTVMTK